MKKHKPVVRIIALIGVLGLLLGALLPALTAF
jgi:hypothetical protein